jgi:hypothetical protein
MFHTVKYAGEPGKEHNKYIGFRVTINGTLLTLFIL